MIEELSDVAKKLEEVDPILAQSILMLIGFQYSGPLGMSALMAAHTNIKLLAQPVIANNDRLEKSKKGMQA